MTVTCVKMLRWGQQKARKGSCTKKKQLEEHFANNSVHWQQVTDMAGNEKEHLSKVEFLIKEVHQVPVCFMEGLFIFQQDNAEPHTAAVTTLWHHSRSVTVLN